MKSGSRGRGNVNQHMDMLLPMQTEFHRTVHFISVVCCILFCSFLSSICDALWSLNSRRFSSKPCLRRRLKGECQWMLTIKSRMSGRSIGSVTGSREMKRRMRRGMISCESPLESWVGPKTKFFGKRKKGPHGWHAHPRRKRLTARRKPQAREINRQYREFGKKVCKEAWRRDAVSQYRRLLLEVRPDLKPKWRVVESDDEPLSELKKKIELEHLIEEELQAEAAQGASTSY